MSEISQELKPVLGKEDFPKKYVAVGRSLKIYYILSIFHLSKVKSKRLP